VGLGAVLFPPSLEALCFWGSSAKKFPAKKFPSQKGTSFGKPNLTLGMEFVLDIQNLT